MNMLDELTREQLAEIVATLGGAGVELDGIEDLMPLVLNVIARVTDTSRLDRALAKPLTFEVRAALVRRKLELDTLARAPKKTPPAYPGLTARIPEKFGALTHFIDGNGVTFEARIENGVRVIDLSPASFRAFLSSPDGLHWERANPDAPQRLAPGLHHN
jgi:hypothetical protein